MLQRMNRNIFFGPGPKWENKTRFVLLPSETFGINYSVNSLAEFKSELRSRTELFNPDDRISLCRASILSEQAELLKRSALQTAGRSVMQKSGSFYVHL